MIRTTLLLIAALAVSFWLAWPSGRNVWFGFYHDDGLYFVLAKSLAQTGEYRLESVPDAWPMTKYPPLWPAMLSVVWRFWPSYPANLAPAVMLTWLGLPLWTWICLRMWRREGFSETAVLVLGLLLALNPFSVALTLMPLSEMWCSFALAGALFLAGRDKALAAGIAGGLAFLLRAAALPLLISAPLCFLLRKQFKQAAWFVLSMGAMVAGWLLWSQLHLPEGSDPSTLYYTNYSGFYKLTLEHTRLWDLTYVNSDALILAVAELLAIQSSPNLFAMLSLRLLAFGVIAGVVRLWLAGRMRQWGMFALISAVQLIFYMYPATPRFILPLLPLFLAAAWVEADHLAGLVRRTYRRGKSGDRPAAVIFGTLAASAVAFVLWQQASTTFSLVPAQQEQSRAQLDAALPAFDWIRANTGRDDAIFSHADPLVYLHTGRRAISLRVPPTVIWREKQEEIQRFFRVIPETVRRFRLRYILVLDSDYQGESGHIMRPAFQSAIDAAGYRLRAEGPQWRIYETNWR